MFIQLLVSAFLSIVLCAIFLSSKNTELSTLRFGFIIFTMIIYFILNWLGKPTEKDKKRIQLEEEKRDLRRQLEDRDMDEFEIRKILDDMK